MNQNDLKNEFKGNFLELRKIINAWNLIPDAPSDEFDDLNYKILSHLYQNADLKKIQRVVESELTVTYGLFSNEFKSEILINDIMAWWTNK